MEHNDNNTKLPIVLRSLSAMIWNSSWPEAPMSTVCCVCVYVMCLCSIVFVAINNNSISIVFNAIN